MPTPPSKQFPPLVVHMDDLPTYGPPAHSGTVNRRLVEPEFSDGVDLVYGVIEPGGEAERHYHDREFQAFLILKGRATVSLGTDTPQECGPGHVIRIPPGLAHQVLSVGPDPLELVIVYSPRLSGPPIPA